MILYFHLYRALMYGSYQRPRELLWLSGVLLLILAMAEAYTGYVLPWGQMSYWAAKVIMNIFGAIPFIGEPIMHLIQGDYVVSEVTLQRFCISCCGIPDDSFGHGFTFNCITHGGLKQSRWH